jgi:signal transduction histidine kinase/CheY-like chemotaxis protein
VAIAWVGALVADLVINKPLGWSPHGVEFKRAYLFDLNPVGLVATLLATAVAIAAHTGIFGDMLAAWSPLLALVVAMVTAPLVAWWTQGRYYLARQPKLPGPPGSLVQCTVCENHFEAEDTASCPAYDAAICSLCCTLESRCHDRCKPRSRAAEQVSDALTALLPVPWSKRINFRVGHYLVIFLSLAAVLGFVLGVVYYQEGVWGGHGLHEVSSNGMLDGAFIKLYALLLLAAAVCAWWVVLASESRRMAQEELNHQNQLLQREIDAHRRTDAALQQAKELAEAANQAKTRYVAGMTHELRTPLNSILGYAQILRKDETHPEKRRSALDTIHRSGEHLMGLIDGLLDLARIEAGRLRLDPVPVPLHEFLTDVLQMVEPQVQAKGLVCRLDIQGRLPPWVQADAKRLRQILLNLLSNAVRFTDKGEVVLKVDARREVLRFDVVDTGIGIATQDLERIFLPFERGSAGRRNAEPGTGLGLTITHLLTELMGGQLSVVSTAGKGSTFTVKLYLPTANPPHADNRIDMHTPQARRHGYKPVVGYEGPRKELLVVDDQPLQRQMLAGMLMPLGFVVREAASGSECLESVAEACPDAILLDVSMDDMDGWETSLAVRKRGFAEVPIIMVSANVFENRPDNLKAARCQGFVAKPVIESELLDTLAQHLGLVWLTETPKPDEPRVEAATAAQLSAPMPTASVSELRQAAQQGHVQAFANLLARWQQSDPQLQAHWQRLHAMADNFDFEGVQAYLDALEGSRDDA